MSKPTSRTREPETLITECGYPPLMTGRLRNAGYRTWGDLIRANYQEMLKIKGIGLDTMLRILEDLHDYGGHRMAGAPAMSADPADQAEIMSRIRSDKDKAVGRSGHGRSHSASTSRPQSRAKTSAEAPYVEIIVQRGYRCHVCDSITTTTNEAEIPKGMEFAGFTWNDDLGAGKSGPYFLCLKCSSDVAIVGKAIAAVVGVRG